MNNYINMFKRQINNCINYGKEENENNEDNDNRGNDDNQNQNEQKLNQNEDINELNKKNDLEHKILSNENNNISLKDQKEPGKQINSELKDPNGINNNKIEQLNKMIEEKEEKLNELNKLIKKREIEINNLNKQKLNTLAQLNNINQENNKNNELNNKILYKEEINKIETNVENIQNNSKDKEIELKNQLQKNKELVSKKIKDNDENKNILVSKNKEIDSLTEESNKLRLENEKLNKRLIEICKNNNDKDKRMVNLENMKSKKENEKLLESFQQLQKQNNDNELKEPTINIDNTKTEEIDIKELIEQNEEHIFHDNFYDIIIKCNSIYGLKEGWDVLMNEKVKKNYLDNKSNKYTKIGFLGSKNSGKTTILSDFSRIVLPTGLSIKTEGLSIKYPDLERFKNRKLILLESEVLEIPILNNNKYKIIEDENYIFQDKSRDIILTELFLQSFIIKHSDILILILGQLTINEQKLLIKVKKYIQDLNRKKPLIIIHNLRELKTLKQVNDYINNTLKLSSTFSLEVNHEVNLDNEESNWICFFEPESDPKIYHLIYGRKYSEVEDFYNNKTLEFIYNLVSSIPDKESFDPIDCIKNHFIEISQIILEHPIKKGGIIIENNNTNNIKKIMLDKSCEEIILKKCLLNELDMSISQLNGFNVQYSYYLTDNNLYIYVELPGKKENFEEETDYENIEIDTDIEGSLTIIRISGMKKHNIEHYIKDKIIQSYHKRQFGKFNLEVKLYKIQLNEDYELQIKNGCLIIIFGVKKKKQKRKI